MAGVKIGLMYSDLMDFVAPPAFARSCEAWGYRSFWLADHALKARFDPLTALAAVAEATTTIRLGTAVLVLPYRPPYLTAKAATTVDVLSNGRLMLGVGIGDLFHEFEALEIDRKIRGRLSDERLDIIRRLLNEDGVSFDGEFHTFERLTLLPKAVQKPHVPLWLGGHWDRSFAPGVLKRTGRFGDGFIPTYTPVEGYQAAQNAISEHARDRGRDPTSIEWGVMLWTYLEDGSAAARGSGVETMKQRMGVDAVDLSQGTAIGPAEACIASIERYAAIGITEVVLSVVSAPAQMAEQYERIAEVVLPHFA